MLVRYRDRAQYILWSIFTELLRFILWVISSLLMLLNSGDCLDLFCGCFTVPGQDKIFAPVPVKLYRIEHYAIISKQGEKWTEYMIVEMHCNHISHRNIPLHNLPPPPLAPTLCWLMTDFCLLAWKTMVCDTKNKMHLDVVLPYCYLIMWGMSGWNQVHNDRRGDCVLKFSYQLFHAANCNHGYFANFVTCPEPHGLRSS